MQQNTSTIDRRKFLKLSGITGTGFLIGMNHGLANKIVTQDFLSGAETYGYTPWSNIEKS